MLQNTAKFGGACMERTGRVIANKRALQFQFRKADVLSTSMTAKITSLFFFALSLLATAINVINSTSRKPPQRVGCEEIRCLLVLETIKFAISTELLQSLLPAKFRDSKNKKAIQAEKEAACAAGNCHQPPVVTPQPMAPPLGTAGSRRGQIPLGQEVQKVKTESSVLSQKIQIDFRGKTAQPKGPCSHISTKKISLLLDAKEEGAPFWSAVIFYLQTDTQYH